MKKETIFTCAKPLFASGAIAIHSILCILLFFSSCGSETNTNETTPVVFNVTYDNTINGQNLYIIGSSSQLGSWSTFNAVKMTPLTGTSATTSIDFLAGTGISYKYMCKDETGFVLWESGANRVFTPYGEDSITRNDVWRP